MSSFLDTAYPLGHLIIAVIEFVILIFAYPFFRISNNWAMIVLPLVLVSTIYDNVILWSGKFIGEGDLLETLSQVRFLLHYAIIPLFIVVAIELAYSSGARWANKVVRVLSWLLAFGLAAFDLAKNFVGLELVSETFAGVLRYVPAEPSIPIVTILVNIFVLSVGIGIWIRTKNWPWLFVGAIIALVGNALPSGQLGTLPGSASECVLALGLLLTQYDFEDVLEEAEPSTPIYPEGWNYTEYSGYQIFWKEEKPQDDPAYTIYQTGSHKDGDFVRIYVPEHPYQENGKFKVITYLHGFALCLPKFYEDHLKELVQKGYYVFFPDYQESDYPDFTTEEKKERATLRYWLIGTVIFLIRLIFRGEIKKKDFRKIAKEENRFEGLKLASSSVFFIGVTSIFYLFNREFGKNLIRMITTVIESLRNSPEEWLEFSIDSTAIAWEKLCEYSRQEQKQELDLSQKEIDFYVFGHFLGGLLALSWPYCIKKNSDEKIQKFQPKQVITGDPAPNTAMGIPKPALVILGFLGFPFATNKLDIQETGKDLNVPVGILHGNDDKIVRPTQWVKPPLSQQKGSFFAIASTEKKIYFSQSNQAEKLTANHNQSVTDTTYYGDGFMANFGGVKYDPNAYNYQYIWPALNAVIKDEVQANQLENNNGFELNDFQVIEEPK